MTLVQIGRTIINMERVTDIYLGSEKVSVYFGQVESDIELKDASAEAFRAYLRNAAPLYVALSEAQADDMDGNA